MTFFDKIILSINQQTKRTNLNCPPLNWVECG